MTTTNNNTWDRLANAMTGVPNDFSGTFQATTGTVPTETRGCAVCGERVNGPRTAALAFCQAHGPLDPKPCIGRCGRLTTAYESSVCGYCLPCAKTPETTTPPTGEQVYCSQCADYAPRAGAVGMGHGPHGRPLWTCAECAEAAGVGPEPVPLATPLDAPGPVDHVPALAHLRAYAVRMRRAGSAWHRVAGRTPSGLHTTACGRDLSGVVRSTTGEVTCEACRALEGAGATGETVREVAPAVAGAAVDELPPPSAADLDEAAIVRDARAAERRDVVAWLRRVLAISQPVPTTAEAQTTVTVLGNAADLIERGEHVGTPVPAADARGIAFYARQAERDAIAAALRARADRVRAVARDAIGGGVKAILDEAERLDHTAYLIAKGAL